MIEASEQREIFTIAFGQRQTDLPERVRAPHGTVGTPAPMPREQEEGEKGEKEKQEEEEEEEGELEGVEKGEMPEEDDDVGDEV